MGDNRRPRAQSNLVNSQARILLAGVDVYYHFAARSVRFTSLCDDGVEARALWTRLATRLASCLALIALPDHVHALTDSPDPEPLLAAMRSFALWRNRRRGADGSVWRPLDPPRPSTGDKVRRDARYIHLNASRAGLVCDALAWPFSIYRDAVGLAAWPLRRPAHDPIALHRYVSSDPTVAVIGSELPKLHPYPPTLEEIAIAVAALHRSPLDVIRTRGPARRLFIQAARALTAAPLAAIAELAGVLPHAVQRVPGTRDRAVEVVALVAGDPRFAPVPTAEQWERPEWASYGLARGIRRRKVGPKGVTREPGVR